MGVPKRGTWRKFGMARQTFRHAAKLFALGYRFPDGLLAMLASLYSATLEEHILA